MIRPNILLIVIDAARADHFSCYGYHRRTTPNIDRLANQGTVFLNHYAAANETFPSHVSIFTGVHPYFHGAATNRSHYDGRYLTLQEILSKHGYKTVGLSRNPHLAPLRGITRGFQRYHEIWKGENPEEARKIWEREKRETDAKKPFANFVHPDKNKKNKGYLRTLIRQMGKDLRRHTDNIQYFSSVKETFDAFFLSRKKRRQYHRWRRRLEKHDKDKGGKAIISLIKEEIKKCKDKNSNFYIFANILEPHYPYLPPEGYKDIFHKEKVTSDNVLRYLFRHRYIKKLVTELVPEDWAIINALYDSGLVYSDALLGDLFSFMESEGIMDETVIVITSDHGELLGEYGLATHGTSLFGLLIKVPLIIKYPQSFKCGYYEDGLTQSIDLFPTILNLINAEEKGGSFNYKGINLCCDGLKGLNDRFIVIDDIKRSGAHTRPELQIDGNVIERAIITEKFKYVWDNSGKHRLHNIKEDPQEKKNLYSEAYRPTIEALHTKMVNWYLDQLYPQQDFDLYRYDYTKAELDALPPGVQKDEVQKLEKMLKDLGYMD